MKHITSSLCAAVLLAGSTAAHAQYVVSYFNFNGLTNNSNVTTTSITPNAGNGSLSDNFVGNSVTAFSGTTVNAQGSDTAGQALVVTGGSNGNGTPNNTNYLQLNVNTTNFSGLTLSFATQRTSTGFNSNQLSYSTNGGATYTNFGAAYTPASSFATQTFNLSSIAGLNNNANVSFRITFDGATTGQGNNRIDNLKVTAATPAPSSLLSLCLGMPMIGLALRRRKK